MSHIKIYKTDIVERTVANSVTEDILSRLGNYEVSFDLEDCDNVLRIENLNGPVNEPALKRIVENHGHKIESLL
jgi:hypothetical protein